MSLINKLAKLGILGVLAFGSPAKSELVAYWNFNEGKGKTAYDSTGNGNTGTLRNGASWTEGISGTALELDGLDDLVTVVRTPSVDLTEQVTLEGWVKRGSYQDGTIISRNGPFFLAVRNNHVYGGIHTRGGPEGWTHVEGTSNLELNRWYHLGISYDNSYVRVFVNNIEENSAPKTGIMEIRSQPVYIGWGEPGHDQYFHGATDELKIHDIAVPEPPSLVLLGFVTALALSRRR